MTNPGFAALLWDYDGTLVDSEPVWHEEERLLAESHGGQLPPRHWEATMGASVHQTAAYLARHIPGDVDSEALAQEIIDAMVSRLTRDPAPVQPGAEELLATVRALGIPQALVSASWRVILEPFVSQHDGCFDAVISGDVVQRSKPDPEPYRRAAEALGADPVDCLVIEDSPTGVASGLAAGCVVVAVNPELPLQPHPRLVVRNGLAGLDIDGLRQLYQQGRAGE